MSASPVPVPGTPSATPAGSTPTGKTFVAVNVAFVVLSATAVFLRLSAVRLKCVSLGADDYTSIACFVIAIALYAVGIHGGVARLFGTPIVALTVAKANVYSKASLSLKLTEDV